MTETTQRDPKRSMPVETFREGSIGASVWEREGRHGTFHEVTLSRSYVGNGKAGYTGCFRLRDMEQLDEVLLRARQWMAEREGNTLEWNETERIEAQNQDATASIGRNR